MFAAFEYFTSLGHRLKRVRLIKRRGNKEKRQRKGEEQRDNQRLTGEEETCLKAKVDDPTLEYSIYIFACNYNKLFISHLN